MKVRVVFLAVRMPKAYVEFLDRLVNKGIYPSRAEAIRKAIRDFIFQEYEKLEGGAGDADEGCGL